MNLCLHKILCETQMIFISQYFHGPMQFLHHVIESLTQSTKPVPNRLLASDLENQIQFQIHYICRVSVVI